MLYDDVLRLVLGRGVGRDYGTYIALQCPWHDDHSPSLRCYPDYYICDTCQAQGPNLRKLLQALRVAPEREAVKAGGGPSLPDYAHRSDLEHLADEAHAALLRFPNLSYYLEQRRVDSAVRPLRLGWHEGWITLPVYDDQANFWGLVLRATPSVQMTTGRRFMTPAGQPPLAYVPDWDRLRTAQAIYVVFGMFDALTLYVMGRAVATSTGGKDSFNPQWLDLYRTRTYVVADRNEETAAGRPRLMRGLDWRGHALRLGYPDGIKDPNDWFRADQPALERALDAVTQASHIPSLPAKVQTKLCSAKPPLSQRCAHPEHLCVLPKGHTTPHRTICGRRWVNRKKA